jgi:hypothetical protein
MENQNYWRKCAICKKEIGFGAIYQKCSVSSCRKHAFCSVECWDVHSSYMNHKSAWAEEERAPSKDQATSSERTPRRVIVNSKPAQSMVAANNADVPRDILIVASKLKNYVKAKHGMNTSGNVMDALSDIVRFHVDKAIDKAREEGRKTLMDRDF